jgi:hypothetical protein
MSSTVGAVMIRPPFLPSQAGPDASPHPNAVLRYDNPDTTDPAHPPDESLSPHPTDATASDTTPNP